MLTERALSLIHLISIAADLCHVVLSCFRGEKAPRDNPPNGHFFVFSRDDLSPRHAKERHFSCIAFSPPVCRTCIFAWQGERSPRENTPRLLKVSSARLIIFNKKMRKWKTKTRRVNQIKKTLLGHI